MVKEVPIRTACIKLDSFLKWEGIASTGGQAKFLVAGGSVSVNGRPAYQRSLLLRPGDLVEVAGQSYRVSKAE
ncbi:MAG TPA: RNA-binding protein [Clostridiales bacterium UBA8153]|nr:RNA-binding protein [Clostridiales bacterium UBA8153]